MKKATRFEVLLATVWTGWQCGAAWVICIGAIVLLGVLRTAIDADFTFASLAILPVLVIAWVGGKHSGLTAAFPPVKVSIGVAWFGKADRLFPAMLKAADELMYEVKEDGKHDMRSRRIAAM